MKTCIICQSQLEKIRFDWFYQCSTCGLECSDLDLPEYNGAELIAWDDTSEKFLEQLRLDNSNRILSALNKLIPVYDKQLLDVGCAAGWFLETARKYNMRAAGIEPHDKISAHAISTGFNIINGYFPECVPPDERFDCISFNDVFEHLKDSHRILEKCRNFLREDGLLIINLPNSRGFFYQLSRLFLTLGLPDSFFRLWQKGYESPHLYYFNDENLSLLLSQHSFNLIHEDTLPSIALSGLWGRLNEDSSNRLTNSMIYIGIVLAYPFIRYIFPSDIIYHIYQKK